MQENRGIPGWVVLFGSICLLSLPLTLQAQSATMQLWVSPEVTSANQSVGDWSDTSSNEVRFGFPIPANMSDFVGAKVVVISRRSDTLHYSLDISMARDGLPHDLFTQSVGELLIYASEGVINEIDVAHIFPSAHNLAPGLDYVALRFGTKTNLIATVARITLDQIRRRSSVCASNIRAPLDLKENRIRRENPESLANLEPQVKTALRVCGGDTTR